MVQQVNAHVNGITGAIKAQYLYAADGTKLKVQDSGNTSSYDYLGSVRVTVNQNKTVTGRNDYYLFGMRHIGGLVNQDNRYLFNGKEDQVTGGLNLPDYGARMYDQEIGRWFVPEPLSELYYAQGRYNYCLNNPVKFIDPFGLWTTTADGYYTDDPADIERFMNYSVSSSRNGATIDDYADYVDWEMDGGYTSSNGTYSDRTGSYILGPAITIGIDKSGKGTWTNRDDVYNALNPSRFVENPLVTAIHEGHRAFWNHAVTLTSNSLNVIGWGLTMAGQVATFAGQPVGLGLMAVGSTFSLMSTGINMLRDISNENYGRAMISLATTAAFSGLSRFYSLNRIPSSYFKPGNGFDVAGLGTPALMVNTLGFTTDLIINKSRE